MTLKIGEKIKELRKKADVTQERFAEYLNVTAQAVSKWEVGGGYPDIELLPSIANFFNVTIDELMCFDISKNHEKINKIFMQVSRHSLKGAAVEFLRNAVREFPNNYRLLEALTTYLKSEGKSDGEKLKNLHESISISKRIIEDCKDDNMRFRMLESLALSYNQTGDKEKALETAHKLPYALNSREKVFDAILGENRNEAVEISAKKDSIIIENLELFADEKNIQPIFESLNFMLNVPGYINVDFWGISNTVKNNNAYFANCIQVKEIPEEIEQRRENCVKGVILDIKASPKDTTLEIINNFIDNISKSFGYDDVNVIFGIRFDDTMISGEIEATVIELSCRV
jgi:transcriptional regulator with XRE-family HTH domain